MPACNVHGIQGTVLSIKGIHILSIEGKVFRRIVLTESMAWVANETLSKVFVTRCHSSTLLVLLWEPQVFDAFNNVNHLYFL